MDAIRLSPRDNIAVLVRGVAAGTTLQVDGLVLRLPAAVDLGHKVALVPIRRGETILKYGAAIGSATADILPGEHVHLHNMRSDYLPTYTLEDGRLFGDRR